MSAPYLRDRWGMSVREVAYPEMRYVRRELRPVVRRAGAHRVRRWPLGMQQAAFGTGVLIFVLVAWSLPIGLAIVFGPAR